MSTQSFKLYTYHSLSRIKSTEKCLKIAIHQIDSKNEWLPLTVSFTGKFGLVFVLILENALSESFHFKANRKSIGSSKKHYQGFLK